MDDVNYKLFSEREEYLLCRTNLKSDTSTDNVSGLALCKNTKDKEDVEKLNTHWVDRMTSRIKSSERNNI